PWCCELRWANTSRPLVDRLIPAFASIPRTNGSSRASSRGRIGVYTHSRGTLVSATSQQLQVFAGIGGAAAPRMRRDDRDPAVSLPDLARPPADVERRSSGVGLPLGNRKALGHATFKE